MLESEQTLSDALRVARMYYYQDFTTEAIAQALTLSRSKVSRLLSFAKQSGLVEITVRDPKALLQPLEQTLTERFPLRCAKVVSVPKSSSEAEWLSHVAKFSARYLNNLMHDTMSLALAWGTTVSLISQHLLPKPLRDAHVIQLNGSGNTMTIANTYASEIVMRFADNYQAQAHLFPVPTFFDYPETKQALWRERSIQRILKQQAEADIMLFSIGAVEAGVPSHVYSGGYLEPNDVQEMRCEGVVGDIATVFFRADGSYRNIPLNARASGPDLAMLARAKHTLCVVSGLGKIAGLRAALQGGYISDLIIDEPTVQALLASS